MIFSISHSYNKIAVFGLDYARVRCCAGRSTSRTLVSTSCSSVVLTANLQPVISHSIVFYPSEHFRSTPLPNLSLLFSPLL